MKSKNIFTKSLKCVLLNCTVLLLSAACSSDDNSNYTLPVAAGQPMLTKVHVDRESFPDIDYAISYDGNRRIEKIVKTGDADKTISMAYNADDQVTTMAVTGDQAGVYELQYDALKRVNKIVSNGTETQVSYDAATQSYIVNGSTTLKFDTQGDLTDYATFHYNFDATKKGPMANAKSEYGLALIVVGLGVNNFNSKKPMINSTLNGNAYIVRTNTYDANGYVTHSAATGDGSEEISFTYTLL